MKNKNRIRFNSLVRQLYLLAALFFIVFVSIICGANPLVIVPTWVANFTPLFLLAMAAAIVISSGNIDIALGAVMSFLGMCLIICVSIFGGTFGSILLAHIFSIALGLTIYIGIFLAVRHGISSLIITLSVYFIAKGLSTFVQACLQGAGSIGRILGTNYFHSKSGVLPSEYVFSLAGTPLFSLAVVVCSVSFFYYWRFYTRNGLEHVAVGYDPVAARFAGISCNKVYLLTFFKAGILVVIATLIRFHGQTQGGWAPSIGWGEELLAIAVAVIGGTRISGGRFDPIAVSLSALVIYALRDIVTNDFNLPSEIASIVFGVVMVLVAFLDSRTQKK